MVDGKDRSKDRSQDRSKGRATKNPKPSFSRKNSIHRSKKEATRKSSKHARSTNTQDDLEVKLLEKQAAYRRRAVDYYDRADREKRNSYQMDNVLSNRALASLHHHSNASVRIDPTTETPLLSFDNGIPAEERDMYHQAHDTAAVEKLNQGHMQDLTLPEVQELFDLLGPDPGTGRLNLNKLTLLLTHMMEPPCSQDEVDTIFEHLPNKGKDYKVTSIQLFDVLCSGPNVEDFVRLRFEHHLELHRSDLVTHICDMAMRHDHFTTLPSTLVYVVCFMTLLWGHLRIYERSQLERSLEAFVNGRDPREYCNTEVDDLDSFWDWTSNVGLQGAFGNPQNSSLYPENRHYVLASRNVLIGDLQVLLQKFDGTESTSWLLASTVGEAYLASHPGDHLEAAKAAAAHLRDSGGSDFQINYAQLSFTTYNELAEMYALVKVKVFLNEFGAVRCIIDAEASAVNPYPDPGWLLYTIDAFFFGITCMLLFEEMMPTLESLRVGGCYGLREYLDIWNIVDWATLIFSFNTLSAWVLTVFAMTDTPLGSLLEDYKLKGDAANFRGDALKGLNDSVGYLQTRYYGLMTAMAINSISIVLKFFHAFQSNPRLRTVGDTFVSMFEDFVHFLMVFATIFLPFVIIAHILFGSDIQVFSSVLNAVNTGTTCLFGDFTWYVDATMLHRPTETLPSTLPAMVLAFWFLSYEFLVLLILLNMLLAVILEHYMNVSDELSTHIDAPYVWQQVSRYLAFRRETRTFIGLDYLHYSLLNDKDPAHPDDFVSACSLLKAFPSMKEEQAVWIVCWLEEAKRRVVAKEAEEYERSKLERFWEDFDKQVSALVRAVLTDAQSTMSHKNAANKKRKSMLNNAKQAAEEEEQGAIECQAELQKLKGSVEELVLEVAKMRRDQACLVARVDQVMACIPREVRQQMKSRLQTKAKVAAEKSRTRRVPVPRPDQLRRTASAEDTF